jgi:hypothetical protein
MEAEPTVSAQLFKPFPFLICSALGDYKFHNLCISPHFLAYLQAHRGKSGCKSEVGIGSTFSSGCRLATVRK